MNDYSDLIYLLGAIMAFSLLSLHTNRMLQMNNRLQLNAEIEYNAVAVAQDQIDQIRWMRTESDFVSHQNTFPKEVLMVTGDDTLVYDVDMSFEDVNLPGSHENIISKRVQVTVKNRYLLLNDHEDNEQAVKFEFMKSFVS